jgi:hypothetical protein
LFDSSKRPTQGGKTPIVATRVVAFGAPTAAQAPAAPVRSNAAANVGTPARPAAAQPGSTVTTVVSPAQATANQGNARATQAQQGRQAPGAAQPAWNERTDEQGRRVIRTPFGDIVRPEKPPDQ